MKQAGQLVLVMLCSLVLATACQQAATLPAETITPPPPTLVPTSEPDFGPSWRLVLRVAVPAKMHVHFVGFLDDTLGIAIGQQGDLSYTVDGGQTWTPARSKASCLYGLDIVDRDVAWICGANRIVRFSQDGGRAWQEAADFGPMQPNHCRHMSFLDGKTGWAASPDYFGMTTDGGATWTRLALPESAADIAAISLRTATDGYVLDARGNVFTTRDGGMTWAAQAVEMEGVTKLLTTYAASAIRFLDAESGIILYQDMHHAWFAVTADGGQTWRREELPGLKLRPALFLARDGKTLTIFTGPEVIVLRYRGTAR